MKHLKLLGLLLAVLTTVFSYGQAGTGDGVIGGDSTATGTIRMMPTETSIQAEVNGRMMNGSGYALGMAMNVNSVHGRFANEGSNFYILDPAIQEIDTAAAGDGSTVNIYQYLLKEYDFNMVTNPNAPSFYFLVMYMGPVGQFSDTLWISAPGVQPIPLVYTVTPGQYIDTTSTAPQLQLRQTQLNFGVTGELGSFQVSSLFGMASNATTIHVQVGGDQCFFVQNDLDVDSAGEYSYTRDVVLPLEGGGQGTAQFTLNVMFSPMGYGSFSGELYVWADDDESHTIIVPLFGVMQEGGGPDTTDVDVPYIYTFQDHYNVTLEQNNEGRLALFEVEGGSYGVSTIYARLSSGTNFRLQGERTPDGGFTLVDQTTIQLPDAGYNNGSITVLFQGQTIGRYTDTLWIWTNDSTVEMLRVLLYGEVVEAQQAPGWIFLGQTGITLSKGASDPNAPMTYIKFNTANIDTLNVMFTHGSNFLIKLNDSDSLMYAGLTLVGEEISRHSQLQILFLGNQAGEYVDTLWLMAPNADPAYLVCTGYIYDDTQPEFSIQQNTLTITASLGDEMQRSMSVVEAYVANIDTVRFRLSGGTHFKILDLAGYLVLDSGQMVSDSDVLVTEAFMTPNMAEYFFGNRTEWKFPVVLMTDEAGEFMDTMWIEPNGVDGIFPIIVYGMVTDPNQAIVWTDNQVTVTLRGDSLIFSGTGSTSDYYSYYSGLAPWVQYIDNLDWYERPHHMVVEPGVTRLGNYALNELSFATIDLGEIDSLGSYVFRYANEIDTLILPATLDYIDYLAFYSVSVNVVINNMRPDVQMNSNPFSNFYMSGGTVIANTMQLLTISYPSYTTVVSDNDSIIDLYVAYGYRYDRHEKGYDIIAHDYLTLDEDTVSALPAMPTMAIDYSMYDTAYCAHVNVPISSSLHLSKLLKKDFLGYVTPFNNFLRGIMWGWSEFYPGETGVMTTLIVDGMMSADTIELRERVYPNQWHFMGLPFNQRMDEISIADHNYYCIRRFDGAVQAAGQYDSVWVDVDADEMLHAGEGFILQMTNNNYSPAEMSFKAQNDAQMQNMFTPSVQSLPLTQYPAELSWNANWNMLVNPYPCFYDTRKIANGGIITVWSRFEGEYFASYSVEDDYYVLQPHEAFLYQAAAGEAALRMPLEGRQHTAVPEGVSQVDWYENGEIYRSPERINRTLLNFYLEQNNNKDHARVVLNETASMSYEVGVDALKMFVPGATAAQLYAEQDGAKQSILERPLGNGMVYLGVRLTEAGECTVSVPENKGMDISLLDTETGVLTDLSHGNYTFFGVPEENSRRFIVGFVGDATLLEFFANSTSDSNVVKVIENGHVFIIRGSEKFDVLGNKH